MKIDFIQRTNGGMVATGSVASRLLKNGMNPASLRPWEGKDGRSYIDTIVDGKPGKMVTNNSTLRRDEWKIFDDGIVEAARLETRAVGDLIAAGLTFNLPNGMAHTVLETERISDITPATVSMNPARRSEGDRPEFDTVLLPLPIIHKDWTLDLRQVMVSRNNGMPLDTTMAKMAARVVMEEAEKMLVGVSEFNAFSYGGGTIYGYTNFPERMLYTLTAPTAGGWTGATLITQVLAMRQLAITALHRGPFMVYVSPAWGAYLDADYSTAKGDNTIRERVQKVDGIRGIRTLDYLEDFDILVVQMTEDVVREVVGMPMTTVQWEENGGMALQFKVMTMLVPQLRADINGNTGIVHGTV